MTPSEKEITYKNATAEILSVVDGIDNVITRMATINCLLSHAFPYYFWTGFYLVDTGAPEQLLVGPYQGTLGCLQIPFGKGVCGSVAVSKQTMVVGDVHAHPNHIACDVNSRSEIVVPVFDKQGILRAVFDVDSKSKNSFDNIDQKYIEALMHKVFGSLSWTAL